MREVLAPRNRTVFVIPAEAGIENVEEAAHCAAFAFGDKGAADPPARGSAASPAGALRARWGSRGSPHPTNEYEAECVGWGERAAEPHRSPTRRGLPVAPGGARCRSAIRGGAWEAVPGAQHGYERERSERI